MNCKKCNAPVNEESKFCGQCGHSVHEVLICQKCKTPIENGKKFCPTCGTLLTLNKGIKNNVSETINNLKNNITTTINNKTPDNIRKKISFLPSFIWCSNEKIEEFVNEYQTKPWYFTPRGWMAIWIIFGISIYFIIVNSNHGYLTKSEIDNIYILFYLQAIFYGIVAYFAIKGYRLTFYIIITINTLRLLHSLLLLEFFEVSFLAISICLCITCIRIENKYKIKRDNDALNHREPDTQNNRGQIYEHGRDMLLNIIAVEQYNRGQIYEHGRGVVKDEAKAVECYRKAAEQGHADAQYNLGNMYAQGLGVAKDEAQAVVWYQKAADRGHHDARRCLHLI